ncbi:arylesterase [Acidicapsa acidisoli]|uniref:arylesterase n=1 Tax=Acidicapsa acidisoli TaxID=1615681 RepID=UPI0021DFFF2C|nr:arylesterase [Acidicapsa acidisoli]
MMRRRNRRLSRLGPLLAICLIAVGMHAASPEKTLVCFGDSITAGYGLDADKSYPAALAELLSKRGYHYRVLNQGVSGNTTKDAVARVNSIVALHPEVVVVEFGGNDGLRGLPLDVTRKNLDSVLATLEAAKIRVLLVGITLPPNYGADYIQTFNAIYRDAANKHHVPLMPMLYDHIYTLPGTIQEDGIHPTAKGSELIAEHLEPLLIPLLRK